ncbi:hypothetical protein J7T55_000634 [Diaporthe amygdali]|uniref:uncharacterized protein n=1 Tax=Phomopsis amygdali TaxID=1214568 RepID=UPI0022FE62AA|nr:uncharacterized protein J7T55_000634 [Diaporthe amygdali]KAJ0110202.1 hypothetical protein J7T55_000634 [Diaporthe amygdali]
MKLATSTIALLVSALLTVSAAPSELNIPTLEIASPEGLTRVVLDGDVGNRADTDVNKTSEYGTEVGESSKDAGAAGEASQYQERNFFHHCMSMRSVPNHARNFHHHSCASASATPSTTTLIVPIAAPTPAPEPVPVPVPVPYPVPAPEPVPVPVPVVVPAPEPVPAPVPVPVPAPASVPVPVPAPAPMPKPVPAPGSCTNASILADTD